MWWHQCRSSDEGLFELNGAFGCEAFGGVVVREDPAVALIDDVGGIGHVGAGEVIEGFTFGMNATQFTVEVLVGAALPGVIRLGEVDLARKCLGDPGMISEFVTVVERDGLDGLRHGSHHGHDGVRDRGLGASSHGMTGEKPGFTLHQRDDRTAVTLLL